MRASPRSVLTLLSSASAVALVAFAASTLLASRQVVPGPASLQEPLAGATAAEPPTPRREAEGARPPSTALFEEFDLCAEPGGTVGADPADSQEWAGGASRLVLEPYHGKYDGIPAFHARVRALQRGLPRAIEVVRTRMELGEERRPTVSVRLLDWPHGPRGFVATTRTEEVDGLKLRVITFATEPLFMGAPNLSRLLVHEATHCWQQEILGSRPPGYPRWLEEGLAQWVSGDGEEEFRAFCRAESTRNEPIPTLMGDQHRRFEGTATHAYSYMAVLRLHRSVPGGGGDALLAELFSARDWKGVLSRGIGMPYSEFVVGMPDWASRFIESRLPHREAYLTGARLFKAGRNAEASAEFESFAEAHPDDILAPKALADAAVCRHRLKEYPVSDWLLEKSNEASRDGDLLGHIAYYRFLNAFESVDWERAGPLGAAYLRDFPYFGASCAKVEERLRRLPK